MNRSATLSTKIFLALAATVVLTTQGLAKQTAEAKMAKSVYVCACNKTSSCPCANMSNRRASAPAATR